MTQPLPKILPVNELKNTASIMKNCKESSVPIVITKNGYGEAVMMSVIVRADVCEDASGGTYQCKLGRDGK